VHRDIVQGRGEPRAGIVRTDALLKIGHPRLQAALLFLEPRELGIRQQAFEEQADPADYARGCIVAIAQLHDHFARRDRARQFNLLAPDLIAGRLKLTPLLVQIGIELRALSDNRVHLTIKRLQISE
jgi:hypothetical protein